MTIRIHQEIVIEAAARVYDVLTDAKQFSRMSGGAPTEIDARPWRGLLVLRRDDPWTQRRVLTG